MWVCGCDCFAIYVCYRLGRGLKMDKRTLKNAWQTARNKRVTVEVLDTFLIEVFVLYSYDHKEEPPFLLGKDLQKALNLPFDVKYRQLERILGGIK